MFSGGIDKQHWAVMGETNLFHWSFSILVENIKKPEVHLSFQGV